MSIWVPWRGEGRTRRAEGPDARRNMQGRQLRGTAQEEVACLWELDNGCVERIWEGSWGDIGEVGLACEMWSGTNPRQGT